jgi:phosphoenolpyruvate carboxylase
MAASKLPNRVKCSPPSTTSPELALYNLETVTTAVIQCQPAEQQRSTTFEPWKETMEELADALPQATTAR